LFDIVVHAAEEPLQDISTFKLGEGPEAEEVAEGETVAPETEEEAAEPAAFGCVRKRGKSTCPDNDIHYYLYAG